jgi:hypothetical protein
MKSQLCSFMAMTLAVFMADLADGRNVQSMVPIADAMAEINVRVPCRQCHRPRLAEGRFGQGR